MAVYFKNDKGALLMNKKFLIVLLLFFSVFLFNLTDVKGASYNSNLVIREINNTANDDGSHTIDYTIYNRGGEHTGSVVVSKELYEAEYWFLVCDTNGNVSYYTCASDNRCMVHWKGENIFAIGFPYSAYARTYNFNTQTFSDTTTLSKNQWNSPVSSSLLPNDILFSKNFLIRYNPYYFTMAYTYFNNNWDNCVDYQALMDNESFVVPQLKYVVDKAFRLYLNDMVGFSSNNSNGEWDGSLSTLELNVYNLTTDMYETQKFNVLSYSDVQKDSSRKLLYRYEI